MDTLIIAVIVAAVIIVILFILKSRSVSTIEHPSAQSGMQNATPEFRDFEGQCEGVEYFADLFDPGTVRIEIEAKIEEPRRLEVNARKKRPAPINDERAREIESLLDYGADYVDIGYNTNSVGAEFPIGKVTVDKDFAERITRMLIKLKNKSV